MTFSLLMNVDHGRMEMLLENMMTGSRLSLLRRQLDEFKDPETRKLAETFVEKMGKVLGKRNHITHGIWGYYFEPVKNELHKACYFARDKEQPIFAKDLKKLADECMIEAKRLSTILTLLNPVAPVVERPRRFFFGSEDKPPKFVE